MVFEKDIELLSEYFSEEAIESFAENLPQETLDELIQVITLIDRKMEKYRDKIRDVGTP